MLVISAKAGDQISIGNGILTVLKTGNTIRLGFEFDPSIHIFREDLSDDGELLAESTEAEREVAMQRAARLAGNK